MLTDSQQLFIKRTLEEFFFFHTNDPVRLQEKDVHDLQIALAARGLTIGPIQPAPAPLVVPAALAAALLPASATTPHALHQTASQALQSAPAASSAPAAGNVLSAADEYFLRTTEAAAHDLRHKSGYSFKAELVSNLVRLIRRHTKRS